MIDEKILRDKVGKKIKALRIDNNLTQEDLAEMLDCSSKYISQIELGTVNISFKKLIQIANVLDEDLEYFLFEADENSNLVNKIGCLKNRERQMVETLVNLLLNG